MNNFIKKSNIDPELIKEYNRNRPAGKNKSFCLAPNNAMRFSVSGNVIPCCFNRGYVYGKYPKKSIHDIWFGEKIKKLRKVIRNNDLTMGCFFCEYNLNNRNFGLIQSKDYDYFPKAGRKGYPSLMEFELSNTCNLQCHMCSGEFSSSYRANIEKMEPYPNPYDNKFIEQLDEFIPHLERALFVGGEPFLINIYYQLWERMIALNPKIELIIITNGTVLNQKIKDLIEKGIFYFAISMDSLKKENFEKIRINANFEQFISNINYFHEYSKRNNRWITINVCPLVQNWQDIPDLLRWANEKNINLYFNNVYFPYFSTIRSLSVSEISEILNFFKLQTFFENKTNSVYEQNMKLYNNFINTLISWKKEAETRKDVIPLTEVEKMKEQFIQLLVNVINSKTSLSQSEKDEKIIQHTKTCETLFHNFIGREDVLSRAIYNIGNLPRDMVYAEMEISDPERLMGRFTQSGI